MDEVGVEEAVGRAEEPPTRAPDRSPTASRASASRGVKPPRACRAVTRELADGEARARRRRRRAGARARPPPPRAARVAARSTSAAPHASLGAVETNASAAPVTVGGRARARGDATSTACSRSAASALRRAERDLGRAAADTRGRRPAEIRSAGLRVQPHRLRRDAALAAMDTSRSSALRRPRRRRTTSQPRTRSSAAIYRRRLHSTRTSTRPAAHAAPSSWRALNDSSVARAHVTCAHAAATIMPVHTVAQKSPVAYTRRDEPAASQHGAADPCQPRRDLRWRH